MFGLLMCVALTLGNQVKLPAEILGAWKGYIVDGAVVAPADTARYMKWDLNLSADGTFKWHQENHIMMDMVYDGSGTYTLAGNTVHILGKATGYVDDGYQKDKSPVNLDFNLVKRGNELFLDMSRKIGNVEMPMWVLFARPDAKPTLPNEMKPKRWIPKRSDPEAVALARKVEERYASLQSYSDAGNESSNGDGYQPEAAAFTVYYVKPDKLYFKSVSPSTLKDARTYIVVAKGGHGWYSKEGSPFGEFDSLSSAVGDLSLPCGIASEIIPGLLIPKLAGAHLSKSRQILELPPVIEQKRKCLVLELTDNPLSVIRLTIDLSNMMILRIETDYAKESVVLHPKFNIPIPASTFEKPRSK